MKCASASTPTWVVTAVPTCSGAANPAAALRCGSAHPAELLGLDAATASQIRDAKGDGKLQLVCDFGGTATYFERELLRTGAL